MKIENYAHFNCIWGIFWQSPARATFKKLLKERSEGKITCDSLVRSVNVVHLIPNDSFLRNITTGTARMANHEDFEKADLLLTMDHFNFLNFQKWLLIRFEIENKTLLRICAPLDEVRIHITEDSGFENVLNLLEEGCHNLLRLEDQQQIIFSVQDLAQISSSISDSRGEKCEIKNFSSVSGGCINQAFCLKDQNGDSFFLKKNSKDFFPFFKAEAEALCEIDKTNTVRVPKMICFGESDFPLFWFLFIKKEIQERWSAKAWRATRSITSYKNATLWLDYRQLYWCHSQPNRNLLLDILLS